MSKDEPPGNDPASRASALLVKAQAAAKAKDALGMVEALHASGFLAGLKRMLQRKWSRLPAADVDDSVADAVESAYTTVSGGRRVADLSLPGLAEDDQFEIRELARSIAANGVRKPPIIDQEGTLLDGNRRITACYFILNSSEFDADQKRRLISVQLLRSTRPRDERAAGVEEPNRSPERPDLGQRLGRQAAR